MNIKEKMEQMVHKNSWDKWSKKDKTLYMKLLEIHNKQAEFGENCIACGSTLGLDCGEAEPDYDEAYCSVGCAGEPRNVVEIIESIINRADYQWNDKEMVCTSVYGHDDKPENVQNILKQNGLDKKEVMRLKKLGIVQEVILDDMAVIIKMDYTRVLNESNYTEEFLLNLG